MHRDDGTLRPAMLTRLALATLVTLAAGAAHAELDPGFYATGCHHLKAHKTAAKAKAQCKRPGDIIQIEGAPVVWTASWHPGKTKAKAIAACQKEARAYLRKNPGASTSDWSCESDVHAVYGPFAHTHGDRDERSYTYFDEGGYWVDENGEAPCFPAGTMVTTPDGATAIEAMQVGDLVLSWDPTTKRLVPARVARVKERVAASVLSLQTSDGHTLRATENHPIWSPSHGDWVLAGALAVGDTVTVMAGRGVTTVAITSLGALPQAGEVKVWDLTIDPTHTFFADGVWVHNY